MEENIVATRLKERLEEVKASILKNAKDEAEMEKLLSEALVLKGQLSIPPTELDCGKMELEFRGETFKIVKTNRGVLYHEYGGYSVFVAPNIDVLYSLLCDMAENHEQYEKEGIMGEDYSLAINAIINVMSVPRLAVLNGDLLYKIATDILEFTNKTIESMEDVALAEPSEAEVILDNVFEEMARKE